MSTAWDRASIHALLDRSPLAVRKAIVAIRNLQTADERALRHTIERNGVGFSKFDAEYMTDLARRIDNGYHLSLEHQAVGRNKVKRYWRQLALIANKSGKPVPPALSGNAVPTPDQRVGSWGV